EPGVARGAEGTSAAFALIPLLLPTVDHDVAFAGSATGPTVGVVAELTLRVHGRLAPIGRVCAPSECARTLLSFNSSPHPRFIGVLPRWPRPNANRSIRSTNCRRLWKS